MTDPRYKKLADLLVNYSTELKKGDRILLDMIDVPDEFTIELIRAVRASGASSFWKFPKRRPPTSATLKCFA
jgi:aminopeptidase